MREDIKERIELIKCGKVPKGYKKTKLGIIPEDWEVVRIQDILEKIDNPVEVKADEEYTQIGIRSHGKGIFYKEPVTGKELGNKRVFWVEPDCFVVNIVFAWERAVARTRKSDKGKIASHRFPMYKLKTNKADLNFICTFFKTQRGNEIMQFASPGGAGRNRTLGQDRFLKSMIMLPPVDEQKKIDDIIACCDSRISLQERKIVEKEKLYNKYINKVVSGQTKYFRKDNTWKRMTLADVFEYIQPSKYIVKNTEYNDDFKIPVLTAGKTFILGYTNETDGIYTDVPVVIFDDFTTDMQYVDFDFKVKSSAMKILKIKKEYDILFMFYTMRTLNYKVGAHERQWISKYSKLEIDVPPLYAQKQMARIFDEFRKELELERKLLLEYQKEKNAIIQLILSGYIRIR
ncbi:hypothetical protein DXC11_07585 [Firmicutes bacterium OM08-11AC]|nr:hypothetical protein DXC11_07585 [Firmicutes bacterium OM08-11AC]